MHAFIFTLEQANTVLGLILNSLLFYAIRRFSGSHLGTYKHLLTIFTMADAHVLVNPRALLVGSTQGVVTDTVFDDRRITALFIALQSVPFILLVIHFLYRYWSVRRPHLVRLFSSKTFVSALVAATSGALIAWYFLCLYGSTGQVDSPGRRDVIANYEAKYGKRIVNAWVVFDYWRDDRMDRALLVTYSVMNAMMASSLTLVTSLAVLTFHHIERAHKISAQAVRLQRKLLIALCAQAAVPSTFVYVPYLFTVNIPFFQIPVTIVHDASVPLTTCFPVLDAAVLILLMPDYRRGLLGLIKMRGESGESAVKVSAIVASKLVATAVAH